MNYLETIETERRNSIYIKLIEIRALETELFNTIGMKKSSNYSFNRMKLNKRIDELQGQYSRIHI